IIPVLFIGTYIYFSSKFLQTIELKSNWEIFKNMTAFVLGNALFIILAVIYFFPTNKNIFKITGQTAEQFDALSKKHNKKSRRNGRIAFNQGSRWRVDTYLTHPFKVNLARNSDHYDRETLRKVFYQNHVNASFFELLVILVFFIVGAFQFNNFFVIPAAASTFLVFTVVLMIISITM